MGPRQAWVDGYDQGWTDAQARFKEIEDLSFARGWLSALREVKTPKKSNLWYKYQIDRLAYGHNPFSRNDKWIPIDAILVRHLEHYLEDGGEKFTP